MKKILLGLLIIGLSVIASACGQSESEQIEDAKQEVQEAIEEILNNVNSTADIIKSDTVDNAMLETDKYTIELLSWDLGYTANPLTKGKEVLCMKFHVANKSEEQITIQNLFEYKIFLDGVKMPSYYSDFYGDDRSFNVTSRSELRGNCETDIYICIDCSINDGHKVEIDFLERYDSTESLDTFEFSIPEETNK